jgi:hypothetical protein
MSYFANRRPNFRLTVPLHGTFRRSFSIIFIHLGLLMGVISSSFLDIISVADLLATSYSAIQKLDSLPPEKFGQPSIDKVTWRDGLPSKKGVSDYLVEAIEFGAQYTHGLCEVCTVDRFRRVCVLYSSTPY